MNGRKVRALGLSLLFLTLVLGACSKKPAEASEPLRIAVAANFTAPIGRIVEAFEQGGGGDVEVSTGSSGKLTAQIENGGPFGVFLSADQERPKRLEESGHAVKGTRFTYAVGVLALYGSGVANPKDGTEDLKKGAFKNLSIANPDTAPYGAAAKQVLEKLGLWAELSPRIVRGENIAQAHQYVESGGAELGFVAMSSLGDRPKHPYWVVPASLHDPIRQDAVLLERGKNDPRARALLDFLRGDEAKKIIAAAGYGTE